MFKLTTTDYDYILLRGRTNIHQWIEMAFNLIDWGTEQELFVIEFFSFRNIIYFGEKNQRIRKRFIGQSNENDIYQIHKTIQFAEWTMLKRTRKKNWYKKKKKKK